MPRTMSHPFFTVLAAVLLIVALGLAGPIAQPVNYHAFADQRMLFGIPNGGDVLSNIGFLLTGVWGLLHASRAKRGDPARPAYIVFFVALVLTAFGSGWYHLAPDNVRLAFDRLPIALACAAILAAALADAMPTARWHGAILTLLGSFGLLSVFWWHLSGDLRLYLLTQIAPLLLIPVLQWQSGAAPARRRAFAIAIGLYVLAKLCELSDKALFDGLAILSGHTLKHLLATAAAVVLARDFTMRATRIRDFRVR
jgi:hypothetical protein